MAQPEKTAKSPRPTRARRLRSKTGKVPVAKKPGAAKGLAKKPVAAKKPALGLTSVQVVGSSLMYTSRGSVRRPGRREIAAPAIEPDAFEPDPRARALLRGREIAMADLRAAGGAFEQAHVRTLLNDVSRQIVERRVREGSLLAVPGPGNRRRYPTFQFTRDGEVVSGLKEVLAALPTRNPWAILNFLVQPDDRLDGRKPIEVLKTGEVALVVSSASAVGRQGG